MYKLLIADDEMIERQAIQYVIDGNFPKIFETKEACNGREALETASDFKPDIIFFDIKMPGINGLEAAGRIHEFLPECRIVLMSAYSYFNYVQEALTLGADDYITKPAPVFKIVAILKKIISSLNESTYKKDKEKEINEKLKHVTECLEKELLVLIASGDISKSAIDNYFELLDIKCEAYLCGVIHVTSEISSCTIDNNKILIILKQEINWKGYKSFIQFIDNEIYLLLFIDHNMNQNDYMSFSSKLLAEINEEVNRKININLSIGIGSMCCQISDIYKSFLQAKTILKNSGMIDVVTNYTDINETNVGKSNSLIKRVIDFIEENYDKDITLENTSEKFRMSPFYLSKFFKQESGENFIDYLTLIRVNKAKEFLSDPVNNVKDVCYMVGYNDPNYFTRVFKKKCGTTPSDYRRKS
jgi:two-component system, response regulator YesN